MRNAASDLLFLLLAPLALLLIVAFVAYRAAQFFLLPHPHTGRPLLQRPATPATTVPAAACVAGR